MSCNKMKKTLWKSSTTTSRGFLVFGYFKNDPWISICLTPTEAVSAVRTARVAGMSLGRRRSSGRNSIGEYIWDYAHPHYIYLLSLHVSWGAGALLLRIASTGNSKSNVDRNLRRCIHKAGVTVPVEITLVPTTVQIRKPKVKVESVYWPTLSMRSWISIIAESYPEIMFAGFRFEEEHLWKPLFSWFWDQYKKIDGSHPAFHELDQASLSSSVPIMLHGDEGRGLRSQAFMVESWQFVISHLGPYTTNTSG